MLWDCPRCNEKNEMEDIVCSACQEPRPYTPLQQLLINAADEYYKHLDEHGLGTITISIREKSREEVEAPESTLDNPVYHTHWILTLSGSLYDLESFFIRENRQENPAVWISDDIKVIEYDNERRCLVVRVLRDEQTFSQLSCAVLSIVSDLKFLVKNIEKWAEKNGRDLKLPATVYAAFQNADSDNRPEIKHILTHPVQYVWGPPGTGKTRHVLLNAVKQVVLAGGQAAVFAPTNSAVENALEPIIELLTEERICSREEILRFGTPSHEFASRYPECCEEVGVQKKVNQMLQQVYAWEEKLERYANAKTAIQALDGLIPLLSAVGELQVTLSEKDADQSLHTVEQHLLKEERERLVGTTAKLHVPIENAERNLGTAQKDISRYYGSSFRKLISSFQSRPEEAVLLSKEKECKDEIRNLVDKRNALEQRIQETLVEEVAQRRIIEQYERERSVILTKLEHRVSSLQQRKTPRPPITAALGNLTIEGIEECKQKLSDIRNKAEEELSRANPDELKSQIAQVRQEMELLGKSTQEVLEQKKVIGMTLDKYISLFMDIPLKCAHKFVDEAGFAPMAKALCLFNDSQIPVTFIGDHKQIPPIIQDGAGNLSARATNLWGLPSMCTRWLIASDNPVRIADDNPPDMKELYPEMHVLNKTYRFGANLAELLDRFIYRCGLASGADDPLKVRVINIKATNAPETRVNLEEASDAVQYLLARDETSTAAIITPYANQVGIIKDNLPLRQKDHVLTVHKSQGREWDIVVFSVVDDGKTGRVPYFTDFLNVQAGADKLLNTALSRAKKELVLVCNVNYWLNRPDADRQLISQLIKLAQEALI